MNRGRETGLKSVILKIHSGLVKRKWTWDCRADKEYHIVDSPSHYFYWVPLWLPLFNSNSLSLTLTLVVCALGSGEHHVVGLIPHILHSIQVLLDCTCLEHICTCGNISGNSVEIFIKLPINYAQVNISGNGILQRRTIASTMITSIEFFVN